MNPFDRKTERDAGEAGLRALLNIPKARDKDALDVLDRPRFALEPRAIRFPNPLIEADRPVFGPRIQPPSLGIPTMEEAGPALLVATAIVGAGLVGAAAQDEGDGRLGPVTRWLGNKGKDALDEMMTTKANKSPLPDDLVCFEGISYEGPDGAPLVADVYRPKDTSADPLPVVVFVHGGGLLMGSRKTNRDYVELLARRGYVVFVPEYRVLEETDGIGAIAAVCAGLSYLESHAAEYGGDLSRMLINAESAGSFPALYTAALLRSPILQNELGIEAPELPVRGLACFGGLLYTTGDDPVGLVYHRAVYGNRLRDKDFMELMNPENPRIETSLPSVLQVTSGADFLKSHTLRYDESLDRAGHDHRLIYYEEGAELTHAFPSLRPELPQSMEVLDELDAWFRELCGQ